MTLPARAEVVVVGGGPAGAATAIALRRRGTPVLLLDRAQFPRDKVCGDVLLPAAQESLRALGLDLAPIAARAYRCTGARYVSSGGPPIAGEFRDAAGTPRPWWMIRRREFDAWLLDEARRAGATVHEGVAVTGVLWADATRVAGVATRSGDLSARFVVGADGVSSVIARQVGAFSRGPQHTCLAARAYVTGLALPDPYLEVFTAARALPGCAWIVPLGRGEANIGIGVLQTTANRLLRTPQALFAELRQESPLFAARLRHAGEITLRGWTLPSAAEGRRLAGPGWLLVGDAGAMVDPFTGHGIQNALAAAVLAAEAIADACASGDDARAADYERRLRAGLRRDVELGAFLQRMHARPRLVRAAAEACARHAGLREIFFALVGHAAPRHELLSAASLARAATRRRATA